jgi:tetratricopeptide (TPR) repeat protein
LIKRILFVVFILLGTLVQRVGPGHAQPAPQPSPLVEQEFKRHLNKALELYKATRFAEAIESFEQAYKLKQIPAILYNLGQAHRKLGHGQEALRYFHLYEQTNPDLSAEERMTLKLQIEGANALVKALQPTAPESAPPPAAAAEPAEPPPAPLCPVEPAAPPVVCPKAIPPPAFRLRRGFYVGVGISAGLAVTGLVIGAVALARSRDLEAAVDPLADAWDRRNAEVRGLSATTDVLLIGAALSFGVTVAVTTLPQLLGKKP